MSSPENQVFQPKLTAADIQRLKTALPTMQPLQKRHTLNLLNDYQRQITQQLGRDSFLEFIRHVYPGYIVGPHHRRLAKIFEEIAAGHKKRVIVNIAPRHGKSEMISYLAPAWYLGKFPHKKIIMASHTADLAVNFGRRVRNLVGSEAYKDVFPRVELQADSKSASRWGTNFNGEYFAIGVGGALAGRGADLFIIDDPHSEQEAKQLRPEVFEPAWEWFQSGPIQRLMPGGAIIIVMCMTGDTPVLRPDGSETLLKDLKPGDEVATYDDGKITTSRVLNHRSNGVDEIFTLSTRSGRVLRANARHPFLVDNNGVRKWVRLKNLRPGMSLVALKAATAPHDPRPDPASATPAKLASPTIADIPAGRDTPWDTTANGPDRLVPLVVAASQPSLKGSAGRTTTSIVGLQVFAALRMRLKSAATHASSVLTDSLKNSIWRWWQSAATAVTSVVNHQLLRMSGHIGTASSASTTATILGRSEGCSATIATSPSDIAILPHSLNPLPVTSDFITDEIVEIVASGQEEVFDLQVERTENFIANGVVSHNTRWSKLDLTGQVIDHYVRHHDIGADEWEVVEFPAVLDGKPLWPDFWSIDELLAKKAGMDIRYWEAQYMQNPVSEEGALIKREWWNIWEQDRPPSCEFTIMALDAAQETNNRADYNALTTWGVFMNEETKAYNVILLNAIKERMEFPELKQKVLEEYKEWQPDSFIVEKKSNGAALYQELRRMGVPVMDFTPGKGQDKIARVNSVADLFASGMVWAPDRRWALEVVEECNDFPAGKNDDLVDSMTLALMRFRQGGFLRLPSDEKDPIEYFKPVRRGGYY